MRRQNSFDRAKRVGGAASATAPSMTRFALRHPRTLPLVRAFGRICTDHVWSNRTRAVFQSLRLAERALRHCCPWAAQPLAIQRAQRLALTPRRETQVRARRFGVPTATLGSGSRPRSKALLAAYRGRWRARVGEPSHASIAEQLGRRFGTARGVDIDRCRAPPTASAARPALLAQRLDATRLVAMAAAPRSGVQGFLRAARARCRPTFRPRPPAPGHTTTRRLRGRRLERGRSWTIAHVQLRRHRPDHTRVSLDMDLDHLRFMSAVPHRACRSTHTGARRAPGDALRSSPPGRWVRPWRAASRCWRRRPERVLSCCSLLRPNSDFESVALLARSVASSASSTSTRDASASFSACDALRSRSADRPPCAATPSCCACAHPHRRDSSAVTRATSACYRRAAHLLRLLERRRHLLRQNRDFQQLAA